MLNVIVVKNGPLLILSLVQCVISYSNIRCCIAYTLCNWAFEWSSIWGVKVSNIKTSNHSKNSNTTNVNSSLILQQASSHVRVSSDDMIVGGLAFSLFYGQGNISIHLVYWKKNPISSTKCKVDGAEIPFQMFAVLFYISEIFLNNHTHRKASNTLKIRDQIPF